MGFIRKFSAVVKVPVDPAADLHIRQTPYGVCPLSMLVLKGDVMAPRSKLTSPKSATQQADLFAKSTEELAREAKNCRNCPLWKNATQTVFGAGSPKARIIFVGEQPGNDEDLSGKPFVGPAGRLLDASLVQAGIDRSKVYITNVVKHFKWEPRGKRRIHKKPSASEIAACRPWLDAEISSIAPAVVVCLGATAAQALLGKTFRVTARRGEFIRSTLAPYVMATVHPSSILRAPDEETRHSEEQKFIADLKLIKKLKI
jgi:uracil-DNA glycosylase